VRCRSPVFQPSFPAALHSSDRNTYRSTPVRYTIAEVRDGSGFVLTGQSLVIMCTVNLNMLRYYRTECFTNAFVNSFIATSSQYRVGEVGMHTASVPVKLSERF